MGARWCERGVWVGLTSLLAACSVFGSIDGERYRVTTSSGGGGEAGAGASAP